MNTQWREVEDLRGNCQPCSKFKREERTIWTLGLRQNPCLLMTAISEDTWKLSYGGLHRAGTALHLLCVTFSNCGLPWLEQNHTVAGAECILFLRDLVLGLGDPFQVLREWLEGTVNALSSVNEESVRNTNCKWTWACSKSLESLWHYGLTYSSIMTPLCRKKWKQQMWFPHPLPIPGCW